MLASDPSLSRISLGALLASVVVCAPTAFSQQASPLVTSPPRTSPWTSAEICWLILVVLLGGVPATVKLYRWFHQFLGLGVFLNWWSWSYLGLTSLLSGLSYCGIAGFLSSQSGASVPLVRRLLAVGGGGASPVLVSLRHRKKSRVIEPGPPDAIEMPSGSTDLNFLLSPVYRLVWECVCERMHSQIRWMAREYPWSHVRDVCCQLLEDNMAAILPYEEGQKAVRQIRACLLYTSDAADE